jgi:succinate-acetate transporter protein
VTTFPDTRARTRSGSPTPEARILLQPVAAPSVLGYFALGSALIVYGSWFAGGWGDATSPESFFPFVLLFGGVGQLGAALWGFRARDAVAAALHGSWAAFFLGLATTYLLVTTKTIAVPARGEHWGALGQWLIYMAVITWTTAFAALRRSPGGFAAQACLAAAATVGAAGLLAPSAGWQHVAGWLMVAAAAFAFVVAAALTLGSAYGLRGDPVEYGGGDPGVKVGQ